MVVVVVVVGENIDDLKFNTFLGRRGEGNDHVTNQLMKKALVLISKSLVSFVHFNCSSKLEDASG